MNTKKENLTSKQRIEQLEAGLGSIYNTLNQLVTQVNSQQAALNEVLKRYDDLTRVLGNKNQVNQEELREASIQNKVEYLKAQILELKNSGLIVDDTEGAINEKSFVVGIEVDKDGNVTNPRLQFALLALQDQALKEKLNGKKVGDVLILEEDKDRLQISELYKIVQPPKAEEKTEAKA